MKWMKQKSEEKCHDIIDSFPASYIIKQHLTVLGYIALQTVRPIVSSIPLLTMCLHFILYRHAWNRIWNLEFQTA